MLFGRNKKGKALEDLTKAQAKESPTEILRRELGRRYDDARWGSSCRTLSFKREGGDENILGTEWLETFRMPDKTWTIMRCRRHETTFSQSAREVKGSGITQTPLKDDAGTSYEGLSFYGAISKLAEYEATQKALNWEIAAAPTVEELGDEYYRKMALNEGLVFDSENMPQPTDGGRLLVPGTFLEEDYMLARKLTRQYDPLDILRGAGEGSKSVFNGNAQLFFADIIYIQQVRCYLSLLQHYASELKDNPVTEEIAYTDFKTRKPTTGRIDVVISGIRDDEDIKGAYYEFSESQQGLDKDDRPRLIGEDQPLRPFYEKVLNLAEFYTDLFMAISHYRAMVRNNASDPEKVLEYIEEAEKSYNQLMGPSAQPGFIKQLVLKSQNEEVMILPGLDKLSGRLDALCSRLMDEKLVSTADLFDSMDAAPADNNAAAKAKPGRGRSDGRTP